MSDQSPPFGAVTLEAVLEDPPQDVTGAPAVHLSHRAVVGTAPPRIAFELRIVNDAIDDMVLTANPYENLTYFLSDAEGWPVQMAAPPHPTKVDHREPPQPSDRMTYLAVTDVQLSGAPIVVGDAVQLSELPLPKGDALIYGLAVSSMTDRRHGSRPSPLRPGHYELSVLLSLTWRSAAAERYLMLSSDPLPVTVEEAGSR